MTAAASTALTASCGSGMISLDPNGSPDLSLLEFYPAVQHLVCNKQRWDEMLLCISQHHQHLLLEKHDNDEGLTDGGTKTRTSLEIVDRPRHLSPTHERANETNAMIIVDGGLTTDNSFYSIDGCGREVK
mmetsp:Transcript_13438/g.32773  ORF Transcript_13438/g.32773 Transcript_13438/m.32773 type:complete len:130 (+) Transcript_13438:1586-1975(+)